jgi:hypothetical protein
MVLTEGQTNVQNRTGFGDGGFGVAPEIFGNLVRHDIKADRVVKSTVIYAGRARGACST